MPEPQQFLKKYLTVQIGKMTTEFNNIDFPVYLDILTATTHCMGSENLGMESRVQKWS